MSFYLKKIALVLICSAVSLVSMAQVLDKRMTVDTLTMAQRVNFRTNMVDWLLMTPNVGVEFDIRGVNWNRWTVGLQARYNWQTSHTFKPGIVYNIAEIKAEYRNYWHTRQISEDYPPHKSKLDKLFSMRRRQIKHPLTTYYRGIYASYSKYSFLMGSEGKQGALLSAGFTYGIVRPLYIYNNGTSLDFELGLSVGAGYTQYDRYVNDREDNCYNKIGHKNWHILPHPVVQELRVGFVYRIGKYPVTSRYRWRSECDVEYMEKRRDYMLALKTKMFNDSTSAAHFKVVYDEYMNFYEKFAKENKVENENKRVEDKAKREAEKQQEAEEKKLRKEEEKAQAEAEKKAKAEEKAKAKEKNNDETSTVETPTVEVPKIDEPQAEAENERKEDGNETE